MTNEDFFALVLALLLFLCPISAVSQSSPAAGPWAGWIQCDHDVQSQGYQRRETQTWKITQSTPVGINGTLMHLYSATWAATGMGSINRTDNNQRTYTGQWTIDVTPPKDIQMVIWVRPDGKLVIRQWGTRQRAEHAVTGTRQVSINGAPPSSINIDHAVNEWIFPVIVEPHTSTRISGSTTTETEGANAELMPQFAPQHNATCKWEFARGANASVPPPPGDTTASNPSGSNPPGANPPGSNPPAGGPSGSQSVQMNVPHGGETWLAGINNNVWWIHNYGSNQLFDIDFSANDGQTWSSLARGVRSTLPDNANHNAAATVRMPATPTNNARIRVSPAGNSAVSAVSPNSFSLVQPQVAVTSPSQGGNLQVSTDTDVTWSVNGDGGVYPAKLEVSRNGGTTWEDNGTIVPEGLEHKRTWHISGPASTQAKVRVTLFDGTSNVQVGQPAVSGTFTIGGGSVANTPCSGPSPSMAMPVTPFLWVLSGAGYAHTGMVGQNTHWVSGVSVGDVGGAGITVEGFNVTDATHALLNLQFDTNDPQFRVGPRTLTVRTATATCTEVVSAPINTIYKPPVLTSVTPASAPQGTQNLTVTLSGEFSSLLAPPQGPNRVDFGAGITLAGPFNVTSNNSATAVITIDASATVGPHDVVVASNSGVGNNATLPGSFSVTAATGGEGALPPGSKSGLGDNHHDLHIPTITQMTPNSGSQGAAGVSVNLTGNSTHFAQGTTTADFGPGITATVNVSSATSATAVLNIDPQAATGVHTITVTTGAETATLKDGFTVNIALTSTLLNQPLTLKPIDIEDLRPKWAQKGAQNVNLDVSSSKAHFVQGTTTADLGGGITVTSIQVVTPAYAKIKFNIDVGAVPGFRTLTLKTGSETAQLNSGFVVAPDPDSYGKFQGSATNLGPLNGTSVFTIHGTVNNPDAVDWFVFTTNPGSEHLTVTLKDVNAPSNFALYVSEVWPCNSTYGSTTPCTYLNPRSYGHAIGSQGGSVTLTPPHSGNPLYVSVGAFEGNWDVRGAGFSLVVSGAGNPTSPSDAGVPVAPPAPVTTTSPPPPPSIVKPQWSGSAKCEIDVTNGPNYIDHQVHTWTIINVPVKNNLYRATWSISGQGFRAVGGYHNGTPPWVGPTVNRDTWTYMAGDENASISFVTLASGELDVISEHPRLTAPSGATGKETYTWLNGNPLCYGYPSTCNQFASQQADPDKNISFDVSEFPFPEIDGKGTSTHISGSAPAKVSYPIMAWQPADATATAHCTWDFQFGIPSVTYVP